MKKENSTDREEQENITIKVYEKVQTFFGNSITGMTSNGKNFVSNIKLLFSGKKRVLTEKNEILKEFYQYEEVSRTEKHSRYTQKEQRIFGLLALLLLNMLLLLLLYIYGYINLREQILTNSPLYIVPAVIIPFWTWIVSTNENFWAFHKRKRTFFSLCSLNAALVLFQPVYTLIRNFMVGIVYKIEPDEIMTQGMINLLAFTGIILLSAAVIIIIYTQMEPLIVSPTIKRNIELFKLQYIKDDREDNEYKYDMRIIKSLDDGSVIATKENDRFVQTEINGPSGTGKTSSIFITAISNDLDTKVKNKEKRQECFLNMIQQKKATIRGPLREFREDAVIAIGNSKSEIAKNKKELDKIRKKYPDCGITVVAPNASLITDIVRLAEARNIKVNILDPIYDYSSYKNAKQIGINPFYIPFNLDENERLIRISEAATVFSDVLIATNQINGEGDQYFTDISLAVSENVSTVIMLANNIKGKQTYIEDVQDCIINFPNLKPYVEIIENHYGISIAGAEVTQKGKAVSAEDILKKTGAGNVNNKNAKSNPYYQQILFVKQELLGAGAEKMFDQARGLRNLINKILKHPRIKSRLSAEKENRIDFDGILANNEITVVNTAIEIAKSTSTAFGLFFILLHKTSVLRRPVETRTPHFLWIDEATQYMHPCYEDMISLYRQYRCAVVITLQSLAQTERSRATAYLKDVFLGAGTHIVFGRLTPDEMKLYAEMGGISRDIVEQKSYSKSSILNTSTSYTESVRSTPTLNNILEGADMRILGFQELTVFTIDNGRVLPGQLGRVFFVTEDAFDKKREKTILWEKAVPEAFRFDVHEESEEQEEVYEPKEKKKLYPELENTQAPPLAAQSVVKKTHEEDKNIEVNEDYNESRLEDIFAFLDSHTQSSTSSISKGEGNSPSNEFGIPPVVTVPAKNTVTGEDIGEDMSQEELQAALNQFKKK